MAALPFAVDGSSGAPDVGAFAESVVGVGARTLGAVAAGLYGVDESESSLVAIHLRGYSDVVRDAFQRVPLRADVPVARAAVARAPMYYPDRASLVHHHRRMVTALPPSGFSAHAAHPVFKGARLLGVFVVSFLVPQAFDEAERQRLRAMAEACAELWPDA